MQPSFLTVRLTENAQQSFDAFRAFYEPRQTSSAAPPPVPRAVHAKHAFTHHEGTVHVNIFVFGAITEGTEAKVEDQKLTLKVAHAYGTMKTEKKFDLPTDFLPSQYEVLLHEQRVELTTKVVDRVDTPPFTIVAQEKEKTGDQISPITRTEGEILVLQKVIADAQKVIADSQKAIADSQKAIADATARLEYLNEHRDNMHAMLIPVLPPQNVVPSGEIPSPPTDPPILEKEEEGEEPEAKRLKANDE